MARKVNPESACLDGKTSPGSEHGPLCGRHLLTYLSNNLSRQFRIPSFPAPRHVIQSHKPTPIPGASSLHYTAAGIGEQSPLHYHTVCQHKKRHTTRRAALYRNSLFSLQTISHIAWRESVLTLEDSKKYILSVMT